MYFLYGLIWDRFDGRVGGKKKSNVSSDVTALKEGAAKIASVIITIAGDGRTEESRPLNRYGKVPLMPHREILIGRLPLSPFGVRPNRLPPPRVEVAAKLF